MFALSIVPLNQTATFTVYNKIGVITQITNAIGTSYCDILHLHGNTKRVLYN